VYSSKRVFVVVAADSAATRLSIPYSSDAVRVEKSRGRDKCYWQ